MWTFRQATAARAGRRVGVVLGACMVVASLLSGTASAKPTPGPPPSGSAERAAVPGGFGSWDELWAMQKKLVAAADRISAVKGDGYAGIVAAPENRELRVYWKGKVPAAVTGLVGTLRRTVPISVLPAAYSEREMRSEADRLGRQEPAVTSVAPEPDGSGLAISTQDVAQLTTPSSTVALHRTVSAPIPLSRLASTPFSRWNDYAPYWGGGAWGVDGGAGLWNGCSTGFAVRVDGRTKMLSAGHCGNNGERAYDGAGDYMGVVSGVNKAADTMLIDTSSAGRVWDGGVGSGEFSKPVVGAAYSYAGNWVCDSGAWSGAVCGIQVRSISNTIWIQHGGYRYPIYQLVKAEQANHTAAIGQGDSGGPVFDLTADWRADIAKGTNTAGDSTTAVPCQGEGGRVCTWRFYYVDVGMTLDAYRATIVTG